MVPSLSLHFGTAKNAIQAGTPLEWTLAGIAGIEGFSHYIQDLKEKNKKFKN